MFGHIVLTVLCLCGVLGINGAELLSNRATAEAGWQADSEVVCSTQVQSQAMRQLIHDTFHCDNLPASAGFNTNRTVVPVVRLDPHLKFLTETMPAQLREDSVPTLQYTVQDISSCRFRASREASGYYVFALRKIIV